MLERALGMPINRRTGVTVGVAADAWNRAANDYSPLALVALSAWCGLVAGLLEVATTIVRKRLVDLNKFYWMSRHFIWLIPLTNLLIFLGLGVVLALGSVYGGRRGRWLAPRLLAAFALLPIFWAAFPRIYGAAGFVLLLGAATRIVPVLQRHVGGLKRVVKVSFPAAFCVVGILAATLWGENRLHERRQEAQPIPQPGAANVLLIVLDTVGAGHLNLYGYPRPTGPTLVELADKGIRFDRVQATSSWTLPSHASMFTGRWFHELSAGWLTPLDDAQPTLAEFLGAHGYATAGFAANYAYCGFDSGLARGFTDYRDFIFPELTALHTAVLVDRSVDGIQLAERVLEDWLALDAFQSAVQRIWRLFKQDRKEAAVVNREFLGWLSTRRQPERPFFAFLNFYDAHYPYELPATGFHRFGARPKSDREAKPLKDWFSLVRRGPSEREIAYVRDFHDDCIADLDEQIGVLIDELTRRRVLERTWVIIAGDHGESFGEHPRVFLHGGSLYQAERHVPLVIIPPRGSPVKRVIPDLVSLRDLPATIVDVLGLYTDSPFPGNSLARFWNRGNAPAGPTPSAATLSEVIPLDPLNPDPEQLVTQPWPLAVLCEGEWTYIRRDGDVSEELFHATRDALEQENLAGDPAMGPTLDRMRQALYRLTGGPLTPKRFKR
jgi:arylsulfatase A-like enzyme